MLLEKEEGTGQGSVVTTDYAMLPAKQRDSICRRLLELMAQHRVLTLDELTHLSGIDDRVVAAYLDILEYYDLIVFKMKEVPCYQLNEACDITDKLRRAVKV